MPRKAGTQFLPFLDTLITEEIVTYEQIPDGSFAICFDCTSLDFTKTATDLKISPKETAFLKNLSNYGFKKHDKNGNRKRYHCDNYQPGHVDTDALIDRCKAANDVCNNKKRKKNESGGASTKSSKVSKMGEQFGGLNFESNLVQIQPDTITRKQSSVFVGNNRIGANNTKGLRCVKNLSKTIDLTGDSNELDNSLNFGTNFDLKSEKNAITSDVSMTYVNQPPVFFPVETSPNYQVVGEDTVPLADFQKLQRDHDLKSMKIEQQSMEIEQLKKEL